MNPSFAIVAAALIGAAVSAQQFVTSPSGLSATEGSQVFLHFTTPSSSSLGRRFQQIDASHAAGFMARSLGWRRDGGTSGGGSNEPPRTMDLEVTMGLHDVAISSENFDANYLPATRQIVFTKKQVNMPDWTGNAGTPAPFDFTVPLDVPFNYAPPLALVIDFTHENVAYAGGAATGGSSVDRSYINPLTSNGTNLGTGCTATGATGAFTQSMRLENSGSGLPVHGMRMRVGASNAPANSTVLLNIDLTDQNLTIPGLCSTLHAGPGISLPFSTSDAAGDVADISLSFAHLPSLIGVSLVTQLASLDPGQPLIPAVLSNGERASVPSDPSSIAHQCIYHWASLPRTAGTLFFGGGMVMQIGI